MCFCGTWQDRKLWQQRSAWLWLSNDGIKSVQYTQSKFYLSINSKKLNLQALLVCVVFICVVRGSHAQHTHTQRVPFPIIALHILYEDRSHLNTEFTNSVSLASQFMMPENWDYIQVWLAFKQVQRIGARVLFLACQALTHWIILSAHLRTF